MAASAPKVSLLLKGWNTIPEVIGSSFIAVLGLGISGVAMWMYYKKDGHHKKYKWQYTVIRPDDPRVANIRKHSGLDD